jgi:type I restriction enzyme S subunit
MENGKITIARGLANGIGFGSTEFHVIRCGPDVLPEWVFAFVSQPAFRAAAKESFTGTAGQQRVPADFVKNSAIPLPPLPEQERLVRLLDEADALRRLRARADARMADFTPALFHEMFGDPARNEKGWPIFKFGEVCECRLGKMLDAKQQTGQQKRPYLRNVNVQWGRFDLSEVLEMDFDEKSRELLRLRVGDILICEGGEVGRCAIWHDELPECYFQKALHRARPNSKLANSEYILWFMWSLAKSDGLSDFTTQSTIAHLTGVKLNSLPVPLPPLALQHEFAARVMEARALEEKQAQSKARLEALFESMLARAFAGEL